MHNPKSLQGIVLIISELVGCFVVWEGGCNHFLLFNKNNVHIEVIQVCNTSLFTAPGDVYLEV